MDRKIVWVIVDGLGDLPVAALEGRTPLEEAKVGNLDLLCSRGWTGMMDPVDAGVACGSDTAHLSLFGYDPFYRGRGAFETVGAGVEMTSEDIAFKCNFAYMNTETGIVEARKALHCAEEAAELCRHLEKLPLLPSFPDHRVTIKHTTDHRCIVKISGPRLSDKITGTDPLKDRLPLLVCTPTDPRGDGVGTFEAGQTCEMVQELHGRIHAALSAHPLNKDKRSRREAEANVVLLRGCSRTIDIPSFHEKHGIRACIVAPTFIIAGISRVLRIELLQAPGATGFFDTDMLSKARTALLALKGGAFDLAFIHIKCVDDCGHEGRADLKVLALERVDEMVGYIVRECSRGDDHLIVVTGDHSTPVLTKDHSAEPVPFVIAHAGDRTLPGSDPRAAFNETSCSAGILGRFRGSSILPMIKRLGDRTLLSEWQQ